MDEGTPVLEIRRDPLALAPERLLVFELTGSVMNFNRAVTQIAGLEFLGAEDDEPDEVDKNPALYLMVPNEGALRNILTLWRDWQKTKTLPSQHRSWKELFAQLKEIRPWGPQDRVGGADLEILEDEINGGGPVIRIELELVFRRDGETAERLATQDVRAVGGRIVSRCRIVGASYHALLVDLPAAALRNIVACEQASLAGSDTILQIRPQSVFQIVPSEEVDSAESGERDRPLQGEPIAAIFDAVPLAAHPRLAGTLRIEDPFDLDRLAVGARIHGTAMASAVVHGDLNAPWPRGLERPVHFVNMMYATPEANQPERFPDRLPADMFEQAIVGMQEGDTPSARHVLIVNASLGDKNKPFAGRMSGWARVVDYLASKYGILFVISAGNHIDSLDTPNMTATQFEDLATAEKTRVALQASASQIAVRRILAPAEAINAITVGALHSDNFTLDRPLPASIFDVWADTGLCTVSSGLGPGFGGAIKPDILAAGGRHHVRLAPDGDHHRLQPLGLNAGTFGGIAVAAPPSTTSLGPNVVARTVGTSVAAALATGVGARAHEALEAAYEDFGRIPAIERAALLKALLVHGAKWTQARDLLIEVLGPPEGKYSYRQKDNVRRYIGYGAFDAEGIINCADDRATIWATGSIAADQGKRFRIPWPAAMSGKPRFHGLSATLAWFSPANPGASAYRAVRMQIVEPDQVGEAGIKATGVHQPDPKQITKGTVVHRRWEGDRAAVLADGSDFVLDVQRQPDDLDAATHFALVVTVQMAGITEIYEQLLARVNVKPRTRVGINT